MNKKILRIIILFACVKTAALIEKKACTVDSLVQDAYRNRSSLHALEYFTQSQCYNERVALSGYFPQIYLRTTAEANNFLPDPNMTDVTINQLIWSFSGPLQQYKIAQYNTQIARLQERIHRDTIRQQIEQSFLNAWNVTVQKDANDLLDRSSLKQYINAQEQNKVGLISTSSWHIQQATYAQSQSQVKSYSDNVAIAFFTVDRYLEHHFNQPIEKCMIESFINLSLERSKQRSLAQYLELSWAHRKELAIKDQEIEQQKKLESYYIGAYAPSAGFFSTIHHGFFSTSFNEELIITWEVGIEFIWTFDGLGNVFRNRSAQATEYEKIMEKHNTFQVIKLEIETAYHELQKLQKQLDSVEQQLEAGRVTFALQEKQYEVGQLSLDDYTSAQYDWANIQYTYTQAKVRVASKYRELMYKTGYPEFDYDYFNSTSEICLKK